MFICEPKEVQKQMADSTELLPDAETSASFQS